ncbi:glycoside hydrolase [Dyadobacter sp. CY261]|uniref:sialidase family protein n=1 Tax=Dyadobacter sp. CY261 TaxID=2907203 RepID=UPI001F328630|nr:sialidase family protein [Dyadobacter sp. CY261]MCF0074700.1 glycoside hydrolase [Dyadobacter sp. CY261]
MLRKTFLILTLLAITSAAFSQSDPDLQTLFTAGENGYKSYRIPALIRSKSGVLIAFCEGRKEGAADAGDIDLLMKRSTDHGKTWSSQAVVWDDGPNTCGNPCPVLDEETGEILLLLTHNRGDVPEKDIITKKSASTRTVWLSRSGDHGASWTKPVDITQTTKKPEWGWYATGPGIGIQIKNGPRKGRLVIPCDFSYDDPNGKVRNGPFEYGSHAIYSDDHGKTWQLGGTITPKMNECQVIEVADGNGTLLMNMRSYFGHGRRAQSVSYDGGVSWTAPEDVPELVEPICQASILRYTYKSGKRNRNTMLFLNPASSTKRHNLTLRASFDEGKTWPVIRTISAGPSAYSSLAALPDGRILCLYECGKTGSYEQIVLQSITPEWLFSASSKSP